MKRCATNCCRTCATPAPWTWRCSACTARWWPTATTIAKAICCAAREIVGPDTVIGAELDPHCHLTATMMESADLIVCYKNTPHRHPGPRLRAGRPVRGQGRGRIRPARGVFDCQLISVMHTSREPMRGFVDKLMAMEGKNGVLSISIAHGFPGATPPTWAPRCWSIPMAMPDGPRRWRASWARRSSAFANSCRRPIPTDEALDQALAHGAFPVVLADSADNAGGGAQRRHLHPGTRAGARHRRRGDGSVLGSGLGAALFRGGRGRRGAAARGRSRPCRASRWTCAARCWRSSARPS